MKFIKARYNLDLEEVLKKLADDNCIIKFITETQSCGCYDYTIFFDDSKLPF